MLDFQNSIRILVVKKVAETSAEKLLTEAAVVVLTMTLGVEETGVRPGQLPNTPLTVWAFSKPEFALATVLYSKS